MKQKPEKEIPCEIDRRLRNWRFHWIVANTSHYFVGIIGILFSSLAATNLELFTGLQNIAGVVSAVCFGIIGFAKPRENYIKFARAWRKLDPAVLEYKYGKMELEQLIAVVDECNVIMNSFETPTENIVPGNEGHNI